MTTRSSRRKVGEMQGVSVYLLTFPNGKSYVGIASNPQRRYRQHELSAENGKRYAISNAWRKHGKPTMRIMATAESYEMAYVLEQLYVLGHNSKAPNGYNMTDGGEAIAGLAEEILAERGRKQSKRYWEDEEYRAKMQDAQRRGAAKGAITRRAWYQTPEGRASIDARTSNPKWRAVIAEKNQARAQEPQFRELNRQNTKRRWADPEQREKMNAAREAAQAELRANNPEWVKTRAEKMAAAMRAKWQDPEFLAKMKARKPPVLSPESRKQAVAKRLETMKGRHSESVQKSWATRKASQSES